MKTYTLNEVQDQLIGKQGTPERERFEYDVMTAKKSMRHKGKAVRASSRPMKKVMRNLSRTIGQPAGSLLHIGEQKQPIAS